MDAARGAGVRARPARAVHALARRARALGAQLQSLQGLWTSRCQDDLVSWDRVIFFLKLRGTGWLIGTRLVTLLRKFD